MTSRIRKLVIAAVLLCGAAARAGAQDGAVALQVGTAFRLFTEQAYATVMIGNPLVIDVRADDDRSVLLEPLSPGETNLVFIDARGMVTANVRIRVCDALSNGCTTGHSS